MGQVLLPNAVGSQKKSWPHRLKTSAHGSIPLIHTSAFNSSANCWGMPRSTHLHRLPLSILLCWFSTAIVLLPHVLLPALQFGPFCSPRFRSDQAVRVSVR